MTMLTASLDYELNKGYSISSWSGFNYSHTMKTNWISNRTVITKKLGGFKVGAGVLYTGDYSFDSTSKLFGVITVIKRIKL